MTDTPTAARDFRHGYDLNDDLRPRMAGKVPWEHAEPADLLYVVNTLAACSPMRSERGWFGKPGRQSQSWALYFLMTGQGGSLTGEAYVLVYGAGGRYYGREEWQGEQPTAWRVAICKHEKVEGADARPNWGWHPGECRLCGLDMSVDSSG